MGMTVVCSCCPRGKSSTRPVLLLLALAAAGTPASLFADPTITVTAPNGFEVWEAGTTQLITWDYQDLSSSNTVDISLLRAGEFCECIGITNLGYREFEWPICEFVGDSTDYTVRITCIDCDPPVEDVSNFPFEITGSTPVPTLTVTSPNGYEVWTAGSAQAVTWSSTDPSGYVAAWLLQGGQRHTFIGYVPMEDEAVAWEICPYVGDGSDYSVRLTWFDRCGPDIEDSSDTPFTIAGSWPLPTLTVTSPNGGEVWWADTTQTIAWDSTDPCGDVEIWLTGGETRYDYLGSVPTADGQFDWPILPCIEDDPNLYVLVRWSACQRGAEDTSDAPFEIFGSSVPTLTVTSPIAGEVWGAGTPKTVGWDSSSVNGDVQVELYSAGSFYAYLGQAPAAAGSLAWDIICPGIGDGADYAIRLCMPACSVEVFSDDFAIIASVTPTLTLTNPIGGEIWAAGSAHAITWDSANLSGYLDIYVPSGSDYHSGHMLIPVADDGFTWPIAPTLPPGNYAGVRIASYDCGPVLTSAAGEFEVTERLTPLGDLDGDGDVDLRDLASLQTCFTGRGPTSLDPVCDSFDFEPDGDADIHDLVEVIGSMSGP